MFIAGFEKTAGKLSKLVKTVKARKGELREIGLIAAGMGGLTYAAHKLTAKKNGKKK